MLTVVEGAWAKATPASPLPAVTGSDNGDVLTVVQGAWAKAGPNVIVLTSEQDLISKSFNDMFGYLEAGKLVLAVLTGEEDGAPYGLTYILSYAVYSSFSEQRMYIVKFSCVADTTDIEVMTLGAETATEPLHFLS